MTTGASEYQPVTLEQTPLNLEWLIKGWRLKGLELRARHDGSVGDMVQALLVTCAEELEEEVARLRKEGWKMARVKVSKPAASE